MVPAGLASVQCASINMSAHYVAASIPSRPELERGARSLEEVGTHLVLEKGPSSLRVTVLEVMLRGYPDQATASYLLQGFKFGFFIPFQGLRIPVMSENLWSVNGLGDIARAKLDKEVQEGRVLGPFAKPPVLNLRVLLLGVVPKKTPGEF